MKLKIKKYLIICILVVFLVDLVIICFLFKSRSFSHLAIWRIVESDKQEDFCWAPKHAPKYFKFEQDRQELYFFKEDIFPLIRNENNEIDIVIKTAKYVTGLGRNNIASDLFIKWASPEELLRQIKRGARGAHCFHKSILLSTYISSLGMKTRIWALENEKFDGIPHSISEVYIKDLGKWVFIDVSLDFYVTKNGEPLSLLELRKELLEGLGDNIVFHNISNGFRERDKLPFGYSRLIKCVFLRADNDYINKYNTGRYGFLSFFQRHLDSFPDNVRRGLEYLLGRQDIFIHYVDRYSGSLKYDIIIAKIVFYFLILNLLFFSFLLVAGFLYLLARIIKLKRSSRVYI